MEGDGNFVCLHSNRNFKMWFTCFNDEDYEDDDDDDDNNLQIYKLKQNLQIGLYSKEWDLSQ